MKERILKLVDNRVPALMWLSLASLPLGLMTIIGGRSSVGAIIGFLTRCALTAWLCVNLVKLNKGDYKAGLNGIRKYEKVNFIVTCIILGLVILLFTVWLVLLLTGLFSSVLTDGGIGEPGSLIPAFIALLLFISLAVFAIVGECSVNNTARRVYELVTRKISTNGLTQSKLPEVFAFTAAVLSVLPAVPGVVSGAVETWGPVSSEALQKLTAQGTPFTYAVSMLSGIVSTAALIIAYTLLRDVRKAINETK